MENEPDFVVAERQRVSAVYQRKDDQGPVKLPWDPATAFKDGEKRRFAAMMLHEAGVFPRRGDQCLEVGFGTLGWLGELIAWGVRETDLHGIEVLPDRVAHVREILPLADLRVGDAWALPWEDNTFALVIASTLFSSILDARLRGRAAEEVTRVLRPGGALLWYDMAMHPRVPHMEAIGRKQIAQLFPRLQGKIRGITLLPPLARFLVPKSWICATALGAIPWLRTHLLGVLVKKS